VKNGIGNFHGQRRSNEQRVFQPHGLQSTATGVSITRNRTVTVACQGQRQQSTGMIAQDGLGNVGERAKRIFFPGERDRDGELFQSRSEPVVVAFIANGSGSRSTRPRGRW
jgi:hypothetical protein